MHQDILEQQDPELRDLKLIEYSNPFLNHQTSKSIILKLRDLLL